MRNDKEDLKEYFKNCINSLWETKSLDVCNAKQIKHNVEWFTPFIESFESNKEFCDFLNSVESEYTIKKDIEGKPVLNKDGEEIKLPTKATIFKNEYLKAFNSFQYGDSLLESHYEKFLRFLNYTTYKHAYLISKSYALLNDAKLKTKVRMITTKGIVALNMKSKAKQKPVRDAIKVDKESGISEYRFFPERFKGAWEYSSYLKDSVVNTFIKNNAKKLQTKRTDKEVNNEYSFLRGYHFKYEKLGDNELSAFKGKQEASKEKYKLSKRITKNDNQMVINLMAQVMPDWNEADIKVKKSLMTFLNQKVFSQKKWQPIKEGTANDSLQREFIKKVTSAIEAFE